MDISDCLSPRDGVLIETRIRPQKQADSFGLAASQVAADALNGFGVMRGTRLMVQ